MTVIEAWILLVSNLPYNMGYEGDEIEEMSAEIAEYNEAIERVERVVFDGHAYPYSKED